MLHVRHPSGPCESNALVLSRGCGDFGGGGILSSNYNRCAGGRGGGESYYYAGGYCGEGRGYPRRRWEGGLTRAETDICRSLRHILTRFQNRTQNVNRENEDDEEKEEVAVVRPMLFPPEKKRKCMGCAVDVLKDIYEMPSK